MKKIAWHCDQGKLVAAEPLRREPPPCVIAGGDWTTAVVSWQVRTSSVWFHLSKVAEHGTLPLQRQGSFYFPPLRQDTSFGQLVDDRTDDCAFGAMMLLASAKVQKTTFSDDCRGSVTALGCQPHTADKSGFRSHRGLLDCRRTKGCRFPHFLESNSVTVLRNFHGFARCIRRSTSQTLRGRPTGSCLPDTLQLPGFTSMRLAVLGSCCRLAKCRRFAGSGRYSLQCRGISKDPQWEARMDASDSK